MPFNASKPAEYAADDAEVMAPEGESHAPPDPIVGSSTVQEGATSRKVGDGDPPLGVNRTIKSLDAFRVDPTGQHLTTNQGVPVADNQNSLRAGLRGPTLLEDFILREKIEASTTSESRSAWCTLAARAHTASSSAPPRWAR